MRIFIGIFTMSALLVSCTLKERELRTPAPTFKRVSTDFFFEFSKDRKTYKPRRFIFGVSSEDLAGSRVEQVFRDHYNTEGHSNIEFEFNEEGNRLLARLVNPTYPDKKTKWPIILSFQISKNYYQENAKDALGRETHNEIERTDKSDPRARPYINLELSSLKIIRNHGSPQLTHKIEDIDWSEDGRFLGFTRVVGSQELGRQAQSRDRVNFLRIESTPEDFVSTPFNKQNDKYINLLHILGERPNHFGERLRAVHWDINSKTKKKHTFYLHNFPERYLHVGIDAIEAWNDSFESLVGYRPFEHKISERKYSFDLRYNTINWVNDIRLAAAGGLGVANITADLTSGRVLWSGITIWGGLIDYYVNNSTPSVGHSLNSIEYNHNISYLAPRNYLPKNGNLLKKANHSEDLLQSLLVQMNFKNTSQLGSTLDVSEFSESKNAETSANKKIDFLSINTERELRRVYRKLEKSKKINIDLDNSVLVNRTLSLSQIQKDIGLGSSDESSLKSQLGLSKADSLNTKLNLSQVLRSGKLNEVPSYMKNSRFDGELDGLRILRGVKSAIATLEEQGKPVDVFNIQKVFIKATLLHEIGHSLGLGHNFKGNILPEEGTIPDYIYKKLRKDALDNMKNQTTVMDYYDTFSMILTPYEDMQPGPNDTTRLRYLYKQEFPLYDKSLNGKGDYHWQKLGSDGLIVSQVRKGNKVLTPGYLPGCNDLDATFYSDPYCNRHDRGYNAKTIVNAYFSNFWQFLYANLESSSVSMQSRDYQKIEKRMWWMASKTLTRTRFFYDYMRLKYRDEVASLNSAQGDVFATYNNMISFSESCQSLEGLDSKKLAAKKSQKLAGLFIEKNNDGEFVINEFGSLCLATASFFKNISQLLQIQGKEYTEVDYLDKRSSGSVLGGEARSDYSQFYGNWKNISLFPIKLNILQSVLLPYASMNYRGLQVPLYPYNRPDTSFNMSTLYPQEFLKLLRSLVESAIKINHKENQFGISKSLLYLGYFSSFQSYSNDFKIFPVEILDAILSQTQFRLSNTWIEVDAEKESGSEYASSFRATMHSSLNVHGGEGVGDAYLYTLDRFIVKSPSNSLVLPLTAIHWNTSSKGSIYGLRLDYEPSFNFPKLENYSPRNFFINHYESILDSCIEGNGKGLSSFFNSFSKVKGIKIPYDISKRPAAYREVNESLIQSLNIFSKEKSFDLNICERALKSQKILVIGAALMNGLSFEETSKYFEQGEQ